MKIQSVKNKFTKVKKFLRDERTLEILETIAKLGTIFFLSVAAPNAAGHIIKLLGWVPDCRNKYRTERILKSLKRKNFIRYWVKDGKGGLKLTGDGEMHLAKLKTKSIKLPLGKQWDGLWRMVTFDIPEKLKINRGRFARVLNLIGMYNLEKSIFIYPHECKEQVLEIAELYKVSKYVRYIVAHSIKPNMELEINFPFTKNVKRFV